MTLSLLLWLAFVVATATVVATNPRLRQAVAFAVIAAATIAIPLAALSYPSPWLPTGQQTVLGVRVDVDKAIYVMLGDPSSSGGEPRLFVLPYSEQTAQQLQAAQDGAADGEGAVVMTQGEDGSPGFAEEGGGSSPPKNAEVPLL
ncbi:hypothetical protein B5M44_03975 [Shinella sumterensis]|uniref:hypothetical protein n=1 Tax=Shinella sumterensis TaxID=1967501 RepID=UPI00106E714D|nr:hypothetical protein [Shinella sumterensis]MCD1264099.1 hypothetical protein [Shinella sumterensis]TFE99372.1 hypothetical protein B5M44_03975 [Shinella sumterensis]